MWQVSGRGPDGEKQRRREEGSGCPRTRLHPSGGSHSYFGGVNFLPILGNCRHAHLSGMSQASPACDCRIRSHSFELLKFTSEKGSADLAERQLPEEPRGALL